MAKTWLWNEIAGCDGVFAELEEAPRVKFNVCYVTNRHACQWFLNWGFEDWYGMGEEIGNYLFRSVLLSACFELGFVSCGIRCAFCALCVSGVVGGMIYQENVR